MRHRLHYYYCVLHNPNVLVAASKRVPEVNVCSNKVLKFSSGGTSQCRLTDIMFLYLCILEDNGWVKTCIEYEVEGARPRARPKKSWREIVEKDCQARGSTKNALNFLPLRCYASTSIAMAILSLCVFLCSFVCVSHTCFVSKQLNVSS